MDLKEIIELRKQNGISQYKLAKFSNLTPAMISSWELGKAVPTDQQLQTLSLTLNKVINALESGNNVLKKRGKTSNVLKKNKPELIKTPEKYRELIATPDSVTPFTKKLQDLYEAQNAPQVEGAPKVISLFSGCGGLDYGFAAAGFKLLGHVELEASANNIYKANFPKTELLGTDITQISDHEIRQWKERFGSIDVFIGGPPCQGFSLVGKRNPEDVRNRLYEYYVNMVSIVKPKVFVMENVRLLTSMKNEKGELFIEKIISAFEKVGYTLFINEVNAKNYGVPQSRERLIIVGIREDLLKEHYFVFPNGRYYGLSDDQCVTFREATKDLMTLESGEISADPLHWSVSHPEHVIEWLKDVKEGESAHDNPDPKKRPPSGFNTTYKRIKWDEPCSTISTNFGMISGSRNVHPVSTRSFTIREAARCQSFPDQFVFFGKWGDIRKAIGNAVPPLLAYEIAKAIKKQLFD